MRWRPFLKLCRRVLIGLLMRQKWHCRLLNHIDVSFSAQGELIAAWIEHHAIFIQILLGISLMVELCSFVLTTNKKYAFFYSFLLLFMHIGIYIMLNITFPTVSNPLIIFFINPLYLIFLAGRSIYFLIKPQSILQSQI
jgi:hypothetical protein